MAKRRKDLQHLYSRVLRSAVAGRLDCLPVYSRSRELGLGPTVLYVFRPFRARWTYVHKAVRQSRKDNRTTIPTGPLIATYVTIGLRSPLQEVLDRNDQEELRANFIVAKARPPKVKVFQVVKDLSAALRQTEHIFAGYYRELGELEEAKMKLEDLLRKHRSSAAILFHEELLTIRLEIAAINLRIAEIQQISTDRAARDLAIRFVVRESFSRIVFYTKALENLSRSVNRMKRGYRREQVAAYLRSLDEELSFFASNEIKPYRIGVRRVIHLIINDEKGELSSGRVVSLLFQAQQHLKSMARALVRWAETLDKSEEAAAQAMRLATPPGT